MYNCSGSIEDTARDIVFCINFLLFILINYKFIILSNLIYFNWLFHLRVNYVIIYLLNKQNNNKQNK